MDFLSVAAAIAQILGTVWLLFLGAKTIPGLVKGISNGRSFFVVLRGLWKSPHFNTNLLFISNLILTLAVLILATLLSVTRSELVILKKANQPTATPVVTMTVLSTTTPTLTPISTSPTSTSTEQPTAQPTETPTALSTPGFATSIPSSIHLQCNCIDPVRVTITKIVLMSDQTSMTWTLTLENVSPNNANISFVQFYLQQGNPPTTNAQKFYATGTAVTDSVSLQPSGQPGAIQTTTLIFNFMPYAISYTLTSILQPCQGFCDSVKFDPADVPFK